MRNHLLAAGLAAAALIPSAAFAQQTCEERSSNRTVGTLAGAGIGALLGGVVAGRDDRTTGAVIGGIGGAIAGNQLTKPRSDCARAYGYYDNNGAWHANAIPAAQAAGYYDRNGAWVDGAPNGYYDNQGRWVSARTDAQASYYTTQGRYVPVSASGYYDVDGRWVAGAASGHYDRNGRWVAGPTVGHYDENGRWMAGQAAGRRDSNGVWIADAQHGYYENGRWIRGEAHGYYDARGRWHATGPYADDRNSNASYRNDGNHYPSYGNDRWSGAPTDFRSRQAWLRTRIERGMQTGSLHQREGARALRQLNVIRREELGLRHYSQGQLGRRDEVRMQAKLDTVSANLRWQRRDARQY